MMRCGNCMEPHARHRMRQAAPPVCPDFKGEYREATEQELDVAYNAAFPGGPKPIATIRTDTPEAQRAARQLLGVEAMQKHFGPGGGGLASFEASLKAAEVQHG